MITKSKTPLQEKVEEKLREDSLLKHFPIEVFDDHGILILQGGVPSKSVAMLIEDLVQRVDGVVGISSTLYIKSIPNLPSTTTSRKSISQSIKTPYY